MESGYKSEHCLSVYFPRLKATLFLLCQPPRPKLSSQRELVGNLTPSWSETPWWPYRYFTLSATVSASWLSLLCTIVQGRRILLCTSTSITALNTDQASSFSHILPTVSYITFILVRAKVLLFSAILSVLNLLLLLLRVLFLDKWLFR